MERLEFLANFIFESDLIESIEDDKSAIKECLKKENSDGHVGAILFLEKLATDKKHLLTEGDIKFIHKLILEEQIQKTEKQIPKNHLLFPLSNEDAGNYRRVTVSIGCHYCPPCAEIPEYMRKFVLKTNWHQIELPEKTDVLSLISDLHYEFEFIHPFIDGNGRTGRALVFYLMLYFKLNPFIFTNRDKNLYYFGLQIRNPEFLRDYFKLKTNETKNPSWP